MKRTVRRLVARGIHGRYSFDISFLPDVNVVYGRNSVGKTTMLHILANILNQSYERFAWLDFEVIKLEFSNGDLIDIVRLESEEPEESKIIVRVNTDIVFQRSKEELRRSRRERNTVFRSTVTKRQKNACAYFPAFRTAIEAILFDSAEPIALRQRYVENTHRTKTARARELFGPFVPDLNYPTPLEISEVLSDELKRAAYLFANTSMRLLSEAFLEVFSSLSQNSSCTEQAETILEEIKELLGNLERTRIGSIPRKEDDIYRELQKVVQDFETDGVQAANVLSVYRDVLADSLNFQQEVYEPIKRYLSAVNGFLEGKQLLLDAGQFRPGPFESTVVRIKSDDGTVSDIKTLSSGERQILSMLYAVTYFCSQGNTVLIDEPELSLHVDWQRKLLPTMVDLLGENQIIVCTHSPEIGAEYFEAIQELTRERTRQIVETETSEEQYHG